MDFKIKSDSDSGHNADKRSPNYSSNAVRLRLATLVAALGLVFLAMHEAGKPETWEKLGFATSPPGANANESPAEPTEPELASPAVASNLLTYWNSFFDSLDKEQKKKLIPFFFGTPDKEATIELWIKTSKKHLQNYLSKSALSDSDIDSIRNSQTTWTQFLDGSIGNDPKLKDSIADIRNIFQQNIFADVEDRSAMNRSVESPAWGWAWSDLSSADQEFLPATYLQLTGQPASYRGKKIRIAGNVRGMQRFKLPSGHELGFESYKVLWVKPADSNRVPYCVYVSYLPEHFPQPADGFVQLNEDVVIDGIFFKLRSYEATNNQVEICPLIVALNIQWAGPNAAVTESESWKPPAWLLISFFVCMPIAAALMAYSVYRSTTQPSEALKINAGDDSDETWHELSKRDDIKSDAQRISELYSKENE